jgi:uncharacterized protein (TIGR00255 family)
MLWKNSDIIAENSVGATESYRQKLIKRIESVLNYSVEGDERIVKEVALFAERVDITEEVVRLKSHITQAKELVLRAFERVQESKGKTLDFFVQEMLREVNTLGAKVSDKNLIHLVIEMKGELEKIKEQAQNIE